MMIQLGHAHNCTGACSQLYPSNTIGLKPDPVWVKLMILKLKFSQVHCR